MNGRRGSGAVATGAATLSTGFSWSDPIADERASSEPGAARGAGSASSVTAGDDDIEFGMRAFKHCVKLFLEAEVERIGGCHHGFRGVVSAASVPTAGD